MRTLLVTGGGRGIGAATARLAAAAGWAVVVNYRERADDAERLCEEIARDGGRALPLRADVSDDAEVVALFAEIDAALGPVHGLVNNAGIVAPAMRVDALEADRIRRVLEVNVLGPFLCAREAIRRMSTRSGGRGGVIVNVSSAAARHGSPNEYVDYAASKGALDTFTIGLAKEVAEEGIRVACIRAAIIETEIHASGGDPGRIERLAHLIPMKRAGRPDEIARAIVWLLSEEASYVTGTILDVSGGR